MKRGRKEGRKKERKEERNKGRKEERNKGRNEERKKRTIEEKGGVLHTLTRCVGGLVELCGPQHIFMCIYI